MPYGAEDDLLLLSGIQHFAFCKRQWALIHIETQWSENLRTAQGRLMHEKADNPFEVDCRQDILVSRAIPLVSMQLGLYGVADVVEFVRTGRDEGIILPDRKGYWMPYPVEYKVGKPKTDERDEVQLCAQAICLEETYGIHIPFAFLYYGMPRRRTEVLLDGSLRQKTMELSHAMHEMFNTKTVPQARKTSKCKGCSMLDACMPGMLKNVEYYVKSFIKNLDTPINE